MILNLENKHFHYWIKLELIIFRMYVHITRSFLSGHQTPAERPMDVSMTPGRHIDVQCSSYGRLMSTGFHSAKKKLQRNLTSVVIWVACVLCLTHYRGSLIVGRLDNISLFYFTLYI